MSKRGKLLRALACALAISANGVGALAQEQRMRRPMPPPPPPGEPVEKDRIMFTAMAGGEMPVQEGGVVLGGPGEYSFTFVSSEMAFDSRVVKGAPFSAEAVTESVQSLGDGNRITRKTSARLFRDSEGRTRREQALNGIGSWTTTDEAAQTVFINDPVAGANYVLNPKSHTAQKSAQYFFKRAEGQPLSVRAGEASVVATATPLNTRIRAGVLNARAEKRVQPSYPAIARAAGAAGTVEVEVTVDEGGNVASARAISGHPLLQQAAVDAARQWSFKPTMLEGKAVKVAGVITFNFVLSGKETDQAAPGVGAPPPPSPMKIRTRAPGNPPEPPKFPETRESLGKQTVEGVEAEGTRTTVTIPAGAIGNERAIQIVSERWYSPELQTVVMTKHSDPRFGETTYRLTNVSRGEPDHSLFEVPAGFEVTPPPPPGGMLMRTMKRDQ
ncbi:MAG TPA: energy transducer TonB [Pyrinomonadaceae bacterium]|nr:energy transducer TonB [Pyrinomonadaceae bacterium]